MKFILLLALLPIIYSLDNGLALKPAMGWNPWESFGCNVNETLIKQAADAIVSSGLAALGYEYVNLDDCWQLSRDPVTNVIQADNVTFPSGIAALADYIHNLGLKFGVYTDAGEKTCQGRPGSIYLEDIDAATYASWGVDYVKYDNCYNDNLSPQFRYPRMRDALNKTGRPMYYSLCEWGQDDPWTWASTVGNSWRTTGDLGASWPSIMSVLDQQVGITNYSAPGGWNDMDILEVGVGSLTVTEDQSHFALWAFLKSPLLIGADVRSMTDATKTILTNTEIIAVNQDSLGIAASRLTNATAGQEIWGGPVSDGYAAILFNRGNATVSITADFSLFGLSGAQDIRDLVAHQDLGTFQNSFSVEVPFHGVSVIKLTPSKQREEMLELLSFLAKILDS